MSKNNLGETLEELKEWLDKLGAFAIISAEEILLDTRDSLQLVFDYKEIKPPYINIPAEKEKSWMFLAYDYMSDWGAMHSEIYPFVANTGEVDIEQIRKVILRKLKET